MLKNRAVTLLILLFIIVFISFIQIFRLIVLERDAYLTSSEENRITILPIYSARGLIRLSSEELISENIVFHNLVISLGNKSFSSVNKTIEGIGFDLDIKKTRVEKIKNKIHLNKKSKKVTLIENLSSEQIEKYLFYREKWPSIKLESELRRFLIDGSLFSHVVGYLGRINADELAEEEEFLLFNESWVGKTGLEKQYDETLRGSFGYKTVEVDVYGKEVRELRRIKPSTTNTIYLSLDKNLQRLAKKELNGRRGAIIAIDPNNGLVRALVSSPDFNPNVLNQSEKGNFTEIASDPDGPFFNRVISGNYPPASTIKPFIGLLGLQEGVIDWGTIVEDPGFFQINAEGRKYRGSREEGHGSVNLSKAIIESSDVYFYELATQLSVDKIYAFLGSFGLSNKTGIDIYGEGEGILPNRKWKLGAVGDTWYVGDTVNLGIGQGYITVTPLQLALAISAFANKGKVFRPRVVERIND
ncbi:MAG: penicillin-binding protein 2, partial [Gammaproteobacteria bacterium]|nr:penicillin-binding protein 2 [Gammaproteobacteria bacterium]